MNATYLTRPARVRSRRQQGFFRNLKLLFVSAFAIFFLALSVGAADASANRKVEAFDPIQWVMCMWGEDSVPQFVYQSTQTSDIPFEFLSKSAITGGVDNVDYGLNWLLGVTGSNFVEVNEAITGYKLNPIGETPEEGDATATPAPTPAPAAGGATPPADFNQGVAVNPFDRFGVAGLNFTAYSGEWKHVIVNACDTSGAEPKDPKAGVFYEGRLEPQSTWEDISNSADIRTAQFNKGFGNHWAVSVGNLLANWTFNIAKAMVAITIALIGFSFTDIVSVLGLQDMLASENGSIFSSLFTGIYTPLIAVIFVFTAANIFWVGIVKRQYRTAFTTLLRSVALFIIAIFVAAMPATFIAIPNNIAVTGQALIVTSLNTGLSGGKGLCTTNVGQFQSQLVNDTTAEDQNILDQASANIQSAVGCQFWQMFLLRPWVQGQYGMEWHQLGAAGTTSVGDTAQLTNVNGEMVGDAPVPLGAGTFVNNWALFQISTQTNVHTPIAHEGERSKYTSGVANDWWRIVDALSNYGEEKATITAQGNGPFNVSSEVTYTKPSDNPVLSQWDTWVGNSAANRIWVALSAVVVAGIGLAAPLFFSFLAAIYSLGIAIIMAFAPIMLLLGSWAGRGWEIFKGWGELVINTTMKRIAVGVMLALTIALQAAVIQMMETIDWWQGILLLILVSILAIKSRSKIVEALAGFRFASTNFGATADKMNQQVGGVLKGAGRIAAGTAAGAVGSKYQGGTLASGAQMGFKRELENTAYRSKELRNVMTEYELHRNNQRTKTEDPFNGQKVCVFCQKNLDFEEDQLGTQIFHGGRTVDGNLICWECFSDGIDQDAEEVTFDRKPDYMVQDELTSLGKQRLTLTSQRFTKQSAFNNNAATRYKEQIRTNTLSSGEPSNPALNTRALSKLLQATHIDIQNAEGTNILPEIPTEIAPYVDANALAAAWDSKNYDWIVRVYGAAWSIWFTDVTQTALNKPLDDILLAAQPRIPTKAQEDTNGNS